jgi:hypothetical protein
VGEARTEDRRGWQRLGGREERESKERRKKKIVPAKPVYERRAPTSLAPC